MPDLGRVRSRESVSNRRSTQGKTVQSRPGKEVTEVQESTDDLTTEKTTITAYINSNRNLLKPTYLV